MLSTVQLGLVGEAHTLVDDSNVASAYGSGAVDVFATPAMIALMEGAAASCVAPFLPSGSVSVGTRVDVRHLAATPVGVLVTARAELIEVDGRMYAFRDGAESVGEDSTCLGFGQDRSATGPQDRSRASGRRGFHWIVAETLV
jgi:predicted thioesterase